MKHNAKKGFTLIEILVVVTIIGILASITLLGLGPARRSATDARRVADLRAVQAALEVSYNKNGAYPAAATVTDILAIQTNYSASLNTSLKTTDKIISDNLPNEPTTDGTRKYSYITDTNGTIYQLVAILDTKPGAYAAPTSPFAATATIYGGGCGVAGTGNYANKIIYCVLNP